MAGDQLLISRDFGDFGFIMEAPMCPAFKITREDMKEQSFLAFVKAKFRQHPNLPAFKIVPPIGWTATQEGSELDSIVIGTPIQQLVRKFLHDMP